MGYTLKMTLDCNGGCRSCYEARIRAKKKTPYDIEKIDARLDLIIEEERQKKDAGKETCKSPTFHGGEPLTMKKSDFEYLAKKIYRFWNHCGIQTNGTLIDSEFIEIFKKYNFSVGISLDGDTADLNAGRWNGKPELAKEMTEKVLRNMESLKKAEISMSVITLLRSYNARPERIEDFVSFLERMEKDFGIWSMRTNPVIVYQKKFKKEALLGDDLGYALTTIARWTLADPNRQIFPIRDIVEMLFGYSYSTCSFNQCDVFRTEADMPINHVGEITNCLHGGAAIAGIQILRADNQNMIRYEMLQQVAQENGGCAGCEFWFMCHGGCPGAGVDNDWRNRTRFCEGYKILFKFLSDRIVGMLPNVIMPHEFFPISVSPAHVQFNLRDPRGSTYRKEVMKKRDEIIKAVPEMARKQGTTIKHGDKPHGDHTDRALLKRRI